MADKKLFNLAWIDVLTTTNNHILEPPHDVNISTLIHRCQVTTMQPALAINRLGSLLRHLIVLLHDQETATAQFTTLTTPHYLTCRRVNDLDFNKGQWHTNRRRFQ